MLTSRSQSLLAAVCLIWFGLTNTLLAGGIVVCRDGHGGTRIEWGCSRNTMVSAQRPAAPTAPITKKHRPIRAMTRP
jgi:hypothetical protein